MNNVTILVIDDELAIRRLLKISLESAGYKFLEATSGKEGIVIAANQKPQLIILDLGLPDLDGLNVLKGLREWSAIPVIVLTVKDAEAEKIALLDAGADDFVTKPFAVPELLARIRVALRHTQPEVGTPTFKSGNLFVDFVERTVMVRGGNVHLTATEYEILRILVSHAGKVVTQKQLLTQVWGPHAAEQSLYLRVFMAQLRKKVERNPSQPELIITEPSIGYRFHVTEP